MSMGWPSTLWAYYRSLPGDLGKVGNGLPALRPSRHVTEAVLLSSPPPSPSQMTRRGRLALNTIGYGELGAPLLGNSV